MRTSIVLSMLLAPLCAVAAPTSIDARELSLSARQSPAKPKPCEPIVPTPTEEETEARHDKFAQAFIYKKNITEAFEYISQGYIVGLIGHGISSETLIIILEPQPGRSERIRLCLEHFEPDMGVSKYHSSPDHFQWNTGMAELSQW